ncbi:MAG: IS110 family transposase, partial [Bythopirellula sp.]
MLYLGIDQQSKQITVCVRNQAGKVTLRRQVSTRREKIQQFFDQLLVQDTDFMAIVEVCGFNDWLLAELAKRNCREIVLIHPEKTSKKKTDRRDANMLCESLWLNGARLAAGERLQGLRRVYIPTQQEQDDREITAVRKRISQQRTRTLNKIHRILHKHNLIWDYPTKTFQTKRGRSWLEKLSLPEADRFELDLLLPQWQLWDEQLAKIDEQISHRAGSRDSQETMSNAELLATIPGISVYSGLTLASRIGPIARFRRPESLANYFGLTPSCRNSGETKQRLGSITKQGSGIARFVLGQAVIHVLKKDKYVREWYRRIKRRRGSKIARVAVMRRLTTSIWHMLTHR